MANSELDKKVLYFGLVIALVIAAILLWYMIAIQGDQIKRHRREREKITEEVKDLKKNYTQMLAMVQQKDKVMRDLAILEEAAKRLPTSRDRFKFFVELSDILQLTGVKYSKIVPQKDNVKTFYTELPYEITCLARYHEFGQFLNMIEQNPNRFMRVKEFVVRNDRQRPSLHPITLNVATFMFNERAALKQKK
jgi:Tfp pilus assembly protein PilO